MTFASPSNSRLSRILLILLVLLPILGLIGYNGYAQRQAAIRDTQTESLRLARMATTGYERMVEGARQLLIALAHVPEIQTGDSADCTTFLVSLRDQFPQYVNLGVANRDGRSRCSAVPLAGLNDLQQTPWFIDALNEKTFALGSYGIAQPGLTAALSMGYPVLDAKGEVQAIAYAVMDLSWLEQIAAADELPPESTVQLVDPSGVILGRFPNPAAWVGKSISTHPALASLLQSAEPTQQLTGLDGVNRLYASVRLPGQPGTSNPVLSIGIPSRVAYQEALKAFINNLVVILGIAVLVVAAAWLGGYLYLMARLKALNEAALRLSKGDLSARTGVTSDRNGLDRLARSLDEMAATLERQHAEARLASDALAQSEARFRRLAENAQDIIYRVQIYPDLHYEYISPAVTALTGYSPEEFYADPELSFKRVHSEDIPALETLLRQGVLTDNPLLIRWQHKDGRLSWLEQRNRIVYDNAENRIAIEGIARDVTESKHSEALLQRLLAELKALYGVAQAGTEAKGPDELVERATQIIGETLYPETLGVMLHDPASGVLVPHKSFRSRKMRTFPSVKLGEGVIGQAAASGKVIRVADALQELSTPEPDPLARSVLAVPLGNDGQVIGVLVAASAQANAFSEKDDRLITAFAGELATAFEKLRLLEAERSRRREAETLQECAAALTSSLNLDQVLESILTSLERVVPYTSTSLMLLDGDHLQINASRGFKPGSINNAVKAFESAGHIQEVIETGQPVIISDTHKDPRWRVLPESRDIRAWMGIPLRVKDRVIGLLNVDHNRPGSYTSEAAILALAFASQAAMAIENARLYEAEHSRARELDAAARVYTSLRHAQSHEAMLPVILAQVIDLFSADGASLAMRDYTTGDLVIEQAQGDWADTEGQRVPSRRDTGTQVLLSQQPSSEAARSQPDLFGATPFIAGLPMVVQAQSIGFLYIGRQDPFSESDLRLLTSIADIAANAIHRAILHEKTEQRLKRLSILRTMDMAITSSIDVNFALKILLEETISSLRMDAADVLMFNASTRTLEWREGRGFRNPEALKTRMVLPALPNTEHKLPPIRAIRERRTIITNDLSLIHSERAQRLIQEGFTAEIAIPFIAKGQVKGILEVYSRDPIQGDREWLEFLESLAGQAAIALDNAELFENLERSNLDLSLAYDATIEGWARVLDLRDGETEYHSRRVTEVTVALAREVNLPEDELIHIRRGALLHDIGKMGVPDDILRKDGPLTPEEWEKMRKHPSLAYEWLHSIGYLEPALEIPYCHHEKWDGSGYPRKLKGEEIPLPARIFAIVDVWDALRHDRPYRRAWKEEQVREYLQEQSGKHFDPRVVEAFFQVLDKMKKE